MRLVARIFVFVSALLIILYGILPGLFRSESNFVAAYVVGRNFLAGIDPTLFYRFPDFQKLIDASGLSNRVLFFSPSTPAFIPLDSLLSIPPLVVSRFILAAISVTALVLLVHVTAKVARVSVRRSYSIFLASSFALAANFSQSQPFIILALLLVLGFYASSYHADGVAGAALGIIFPFKVFAAIPAILFLVSKKWKVFLYFVVTSLVLVGVTYLIVGESAVTYYLQRVFPFYLNGKVLNPFSVSYQTAWSFFRALFVYDATLNVHPLFDSVNAYTLAISIFKASVIVPPCYFFYKGIEKNDLRESLIAASFPVVFLSPTGTTSQIILLAPAIISLTEIAFETGRMKTARFILVLYAILCIPIYAALKTYMGVASPFLLYERFFLLLILYITYFFFQLHLVPKHLWVTRAVTTVVVIAAVSATLYFGDRPPVHHFPSPVTPVLSGTRLNAPAFSPGLNEGNLTYITFDSVSVNFVPYNVRVPNDKPYDCYAYVSDQTGESYAIGMIDGKENICYFRTESARAFFAGSSASVSRDGDWGSFLSNGKLYIVRLGSRQIFASDTLDFMPFKIVQAAFNFGRDNEITLVIDSLNGSQAVAKYNLAEEALATSPAPFHVSLVRGNSDDLYLTREERDSTSIWLVKNGTPPERLLAIHGNISDITVIRNHLYFSSDFGRGLNLPTIYEYLPQNPAALRE
ncbi:MAG: DUF2029 domain-containing protein [Bacteroidetes bacterium]|nr:DUF2029 domain-containing protein [Bacteroidota bacterium]MCL5266885.1 DUF2029 domain-containing protein [Bacteroidota bacterium]